MKYIQENKVDKEGEKKEERKDNEGRRIKVTVDDEERN